jgi:hypothetical protein
VAVNHLVEESGLGLAAELTRNLRVDLVHDVFNFIGLLHFQKKLSDVLDHGPRQLSLADNLHVFWLRQHGLT